MNLHENILRVKELMNLMTEGEDYNPANFVKRRLPELEKVLYRAMNNHDDERDFNDFVEMCFDYIHSYFTDHSTLSQENIDELVNYVGENMLPVMEKHFLNKRN